MKVSFLVGTKGQITISKEFRDALGVKPGWRAIQRLEEGRVVIEFLPPPHRRSLAGMLTDATPVRAATEAELRAGIDQAWEGAVRGDWLAQEGEARAGEPAE
jgi:bifunctional DNA-binding transcriptional regulator/antitoxin component of YhaV-PrlF toxin-antitoxin module